MSLPRRRRRMPKRWGGAAAVVVLALLPASRAAADVDSVRSSATGVEITGDVGVISPTPTVSLSADETSGPAALGPFTDTAASVVLPSPFPFNLFSTGPLAVATSAGSLAAEDLVGFVEARALVRTVVLGPNFATATSIASSCRGDDSGVTGATLIEGGMLFGQPFPPTNTPAPNTVVPVEGLGTVTLNEQRATSSVGPGGEVSSQLVVNAVHARFASAAAGGILPQDQEAEAVIGQVICEATSTAGAPAPTTATPTTPAPTVSVPTTRPAVEGGRLPETGGDDLVATGLLAVTGGGALRLALRRLRSHPR
jgi:hypothetical protein